MAARIQIYAGAPVAAVLAAVGDAGTTTSRLNTVCERYLAMVRDQLARIELTREQWHAILDANNGVAMYLGVQNIGWPPRLIWANVDYSPGLGERWGIDQAALVRRLQALPPSALIAIQEVCDRVWARPQRPVDEVLADAGVRYPVPIDG